MKNLQEYWDEQQPFFHLVSEKGFQSIVNEVPSVEDAFTLKDRAIRCMDEGTPGGLHIAGSGILMSEDDIRYFVEQANPDGAFSHGSCGACGIFAREERVHLDDTDACGPEWCERLLTVTGVPYLGHIEKAAMNRPPDFHIARCAYYDAVGSFDYTSIESFPPGFIISRAYMHPDYAKKEAEIACQIALGDHGYHSLISSNTPFYLFALAKSQEDLNAIMTELEEVAGRFEGKVVVDGCVV